MNAGFYGGFRLVLLPRFDPAAVLDAIAREQVGFWIGVPTMYWALLEHVARRPASSRRGRAAPARLRVGRRADAASSVLRRFEETFGVRVLEGYGLSETAPVVCVQPAAAADASPAPSACRSSASTSAASTSEGRPVATGERGEVVVRGPNVMKGYYNRPEATAEAMRNGWFHTGDIGMLDADGYLSIVDRKKDMILRGGFNVYPREIEEVLMTHPAVSLVRGHRRPRRAAGGGGQGVRRPPARRDGDRRGADRLVPRADGGVQVPAIIEFRDALPDERRPARS